MGWANPVRVKRAVAVVFFAAALLFPNAVSAAVRAEGVPGWLRAAVELSLSSVWAEITPETGERSTSEALALLTVVAERVFTGYRVAGSSYDGGNLTVALRSDKGMDWAVEVQPPKLADPFGGWFGESLKGLDEEIGRTIGPLPIDALSWADVPLRDEIESLCALRVPGWRPSLLVKLQEGQGTLQISFTPDPPFVLAIVPDISSSTFPLIFRSDMRGDMLLALSPLIGLPVAWAEQNRKRIEAYAAATLESGSTAEQAKTEVDVVFTPAQLASAKAAVESDRYVVRAWIAAYVGTDDRYPELGVHFGRKFLLTSKFPMELYGEWILSANDFSLESRWGVRWSPWKNVFLGAEQAFPGNQTWFRLWIAGGIREPYFWWRVSGEGDHNLGVGYRLTGHLSLELHYDDRDDDTISLKAIADL